MSFGVLCQKGSYTALVKQRALALKEIEGVLRGIRQNLSPDLIPEEYFDTEVVIFLFEERQQRRQHLVHSECRTWGVAGRQQRRVGRRAAYLVGNQLVAQPC